MKLKIEDKIIEQIQTENRSLALVTLPGMGLSSLINSIINNGYGLFINLDPLVLSDLWEKEYQKRNRGRRFVLHAGIIISIIKQFSLLKYSLDEIFRMNLVGFLSKDLDLSKFALIYVIIDKFHSLPDDLAGVILEETRNLDDHRSESMYSPIKSFRFLIGGPIDLQRLYIEKLKKGVSPATHFSKHRPCEFLITDAEAKRVVEERFPNLDRFDIHFVVEWSKGYLHYIIELSHWLEKQKLDNHDFSIQHSIHKLKEAIEDREAKNLFNYCYEGWERFKNDEEALIILQKSVSSGYALSLSQKAKELVYSGLLLNESTSSDYFYPPNPIVELFIRQRLAEKRLLLPIESTASWTIKKINIEAYSQLIEIENRLRNYIADVLYTQCNCENLDSILIYIKDAFNNADSDHKRGTKWYESILERQKQEEQSPYSSGDTFDSILMYFDFSDLGQIISLCGNYFNDKFVTMLPGFLEELNFIRRRIAHNRPITYTQLRDLSSRWVKIQRIVSRI